MIDLNASLDAAHRLQFGLDCLNKGDMDTALAMFTSVLDVDPNNAHALCNCASVLMKKRRYEEAERRVTQVIVGNAQHGHAWGIKALIAQETAAWANADLYFSRALEYDPSNITLYGNYGYFLQLIGDYERAAQMYTKARDINALDMNVRFNRAMALLTAAETQQQWDEALAEYDIRYLLYRTEFGAMAKPLWTGVEATFNKSLVIVAEQGIGDSVMLARYFGFLRQQQAFKNIYLLCQKHLFGVMSRTDGIDGMFSISSELPEHDYYINSMSLLKATGFPSVQPSNKAYLKPVDWPTPITLDHREDRIKIGLCWFGNAAHGNDRFRSIQIGKFEQVIAGIHGADFYSLQDHSKPGVFCPQRIRPCDVSDLDKLQCVIQQCDLIVTVDTAQAHIAGALGKPVFMLTSRGVDWRWGKDGNRASLWYPTMTMFRSEMPLSWMPTIETVRESIKVFIETWHI